ncbi:hypothetical protein BO70DRAFT_364869 [Aspergillus heteromorphus CBS 117.55]|uniref:MOZ protein represents a chromatin-associated acetyltransferase n=1 Tax=Aspergillus heteromorphus CBS 117.55 TaxID=1448321 RepID=A0A317VD92_9EURO|nr:uncharacterized protein BO70DRAFT_364869 [Aspergillus heteromorphus CBS 117.55]PWY72343.1 hypothetical protein BO70DRAFT_364869 [Aspergillus heteromorphus CBS 117.55]
MAAPRLPFLYPNLMRAVRSCEPHTYRSLRISSSNYPPHHAPFHTSRRHAQETYHRRYGPAAEAHLPPPSKPKDKTSRQQAPLPSSGEDPESSASADSAPPEQPDTQTTTSESSSQTQSNPAATDEPTKDKSVEESESREESEPASEAREAEIVTASPSEPPPRPEEPIRIFHPLNQNPLDGVLHMPSPSSYLSTSGEPSSDENKPPHLAPAPYVHHFDTYSLVQDLSKGAFTEEQSITIMKAVRSMLQNNYDMAKQSLTSKSDVENESYLFQAACSELQSSLQTARTSEMQRQRASRTQLQHESDILSQRLNQELSGLKEDIKGMFNDHKMSTREQQRSIDTSVQELNYKITVSLNSDGKSEIEGLRWILTRRAAMAIAISAFMIILFLKYYSVRKAQETAEKKAKKGTSTKEAKEAAAAAQHPTILKPKSMAAPHVHLGESLG